MFSPFTAGFPVAPQPSNNLSVDSGTSKGGFAYHDLRENKINISSCCQKRFR
jgi:hypothetical protein